MTTFARFRSFVAKRRRPVLVALIAFLFVMLWPVRTTVSGHTSLCVLNESGTPWVGLRVHQFWTVYGWGGSRGEDVKTTDANGCVKFPPRTSVGMLGPRMVRRANAFTTQCSSLLVFGKFGSEFTHRWGPIVGITVTLPVGTWAPVAPPKGSEQDGQSWILGDGPHRYIYVNNVSDLLKEPQAYVSGDAIGFLGDTEITLRLVRIPKR